MLIFQASGKREAQGGFCAPFLWSALSKGGLFSKLDVSNTALFSFTGDAGYCFTALCKLLVVLSKYKNSWQGYSVPLSFNWVGNNCLSKHKILLKLTNA